MDHDFKAIIAVAGMLIPRPAITLRHPPLAVLTLPEPPNRLHADI
jgi:hypothetical protein